MFCIKCGNKIDQNSKFCNKCGNKTSEPVQQHIEVYDPPKQPEIINQNSQQTQLREVVYVKDEKKESGWLGGLIGFAVVGVIIFLISGFFNNQGMEGTWDRTSTNGNIPASTTTQIIFRGDGDRGTGEFVDAFWGNRVSFNWSINDNTFFMSRIPGQEGIVGALGTTWITVNARRTVLTIQYPNGSSATFSRR